MDELNLVQKAIAEEVGPGRRWATIDAMLAWCNDTVKALGPATIR